MATSEVVSVTEKESKLIALCRKMGDGKLTVVVRNGQPDRAEKPIQTVVF